MRSELRRVQRTLLPQVLLTIFVWLALALPAAHGQIFLEKEDTIHVAYKDHLRFYLNRLSRDYLVEMAAKEKVLLQLIQNVAAEIESRGTQAVIKDDPKFGPLYNNIEALIAEYRTELTQVLSLISEIDSLKTTLERQERFAMADQFGNLKDSLVALIDNRELFRYMPKTKKNLANLLQEYNLEIDSLLSYYSNLSELERRLDPEKDRELLERIQRQKANIAGYLNIESKDSTRSEIAEAYAAETTQLIALLEELSTLQKEAVKRNPELLQDVENVKLGLLTRLDKRILSLLGYEDYVLHDRNRLSEIFREWRLTRLAAYEAKYHEYYVMKTALLESATPAQRERMLERDLSDALLNYVNARYRVAEIQLDNVLNDYGTYFDNFESIFFYRAESKYGRLLYEQAYADYLELLKKFPKTEYRQDAFLRLLTICHTLKWTDKFFEHYDAFLAFQDQADEKIRNRIHFLAGYAYLQQGDNRAAGEALERIDKGSKYYIPGLYLSGIAAARRGTYEGAIRLFTSIVDMENVPWADPNLAVIRNNALLKLGFIYYERGEYAQALSYFDAVSRGVEARDKVLIGKAWTHLKVGSYERTVGEVNELFQRYLSSNYTYEALVLAAHCKRLLNQPEEAMRDLRYVAKARGVFELANEYNAERQNILRQLDELERIETEVLDAQSKKMYELIAEIKSSLQGQLRQLTYQGGVGSNLMDDFQSERRAIYRQIQDLDAIIASAKNAGNQKVLNEAMAHRERLVKALATYQSDRMLGKVNYFIDFPLATKESSTRYRKQIVQNLMREMEYEKTKIKENLAAFQSLSANQKAEEQAFVELEALREDLTHLEDRLDRFQAWLSTYEIEQVETDFNHWADFSGFGLSDITMQELQRREARIADYSQHVTSIDHLLRRRKAELEERLARFDGELDKIRKELEAEQIRLDKLEREKFFEKLYFDTSTTEVKG